MTEPLLDLVNRHAADQREVRRRLPDGVCPLWFDALAASHWMLAGDHVVWADGPFTPASIASGRDMWSERSENGPYAVHRVEGLAFVPDGAGCYVFDPARECRDPELVALSRARHDALATPRNPESTP